MGVESRGARLRRVLALPQTAGRDVDDPETTTLRRAIIRRKRFLHRIYDEWYDAIANELPPGPEPVLELGSGAGFMGQQIPNLIASDILAVPGIDVVADGTRLPFQSRSLRGVVMTNVFHHIPDAPRFLAEAARCVRPGGALVMIEPWVTSWSTLVYRRLHSEPFEPDAPHWKLPSRGPLSGANGALPWIVFVRDREVFERDFATWCVASVQPMMPFRYLVSGGVSLRPLVPDFSYPLWQRLEAAMAPWMSTWGMFARIVVRRTETSC